MNINPSCFTNNSDINNTINTSSNQAANEISFDKDSLSLVMTKKYLDLLNLTDSQKALSLREFMLDTLINKWEKGVLSNASVFVQCFQMIVELHDSQQKYQADFEGFQLLRGLSNQKKYLDYKIQDILSASAPSQLTSAPALCGPAIFSLFEKGMGIILDTYISGFGAEMQKHAKSLDQYIASKKKELASWSRQSQKMQMKKKKKQPFMFVDYRLLQEKPMVEISLNLSRLSEMIKEKTAFFLHELSSLSRQPVYLMNQKSFHLVYHIQSLTKAMKTLIDKNKVLIQKIDDDNQFVIGEQKLKKVENALETLELSLQSMQTHLNLLTQVGNLVESTFADPADKNNHSEPSSHVETLFKMLQPKIQQLSAKEERNPKTANQPNLSQLYYEEKRKKFEDILSIIQPFEEKLTPCLMALTDYLKHHAEQGTYTNETINLEALWLELIPPSEERTQNRHRQALAKEITLSTSKSEMIEEDDTAQMASNSSSSTKEIELSFLSQMQEKQTHLQELFANHPYTHLIAEQDPTLAAQFSRDNLHHLRQLFCGFDLLQNALHKPFVLPSVLPGMILDMSAILEQGVSLHYWKLCERLPETHCLTDNLRNTKIWSTLKDCDIQKLMQFNKGTIWARYPSTSALNYQNRSMPEVLELILRSLSNTLSDHERIQIFNQMRELMIKCLSLQETLLESEAKTNWREVLKRKNAADPVPNGSQPVSMPHAALDNLIAKVSSLEPTPQVEEAKNHLLRFKTTLHLANHCKNKYQGVVYRNLLNISIVLEQLLRQACLDQGYDPLLSHHLEDFIKVLSPESTNHADILALSIGRALYYPGCYPENSIVKTLFILEKRAELYRDVEDQFELPHDKYKDLFINGVKKFETMGVKALQDVLTLSEQVNASSLTQNM